MTHLTMYMMEKNKIVALVSMFSLHFLSYHFYMFFPPDKEIQLGFLCYPPPKKI